MPLHNPLDITKPRFSHQDLVGFVVDNNDPEKRQRVRIRIPQLHRNVPDNKLPWCLPDASQSRANAGGGAGSVNVPVNGAKLFVRFEENDPHNPRYSGSPASDDVNKDNELLQENYPHTRGTIDDAGNREATNSENETYDYVHKSGTTIHIDANGAISMTVADNQAIGISGNWNQDVAGRIEIKSSAKIIMRAPDFDFDQGSASPSSPNARSRPQIADQSGNTGF